MSILKCFLLFNFFLILISYLPHFKLKYQEFSFFNFVLNLVFNIYFLVLIISLFYTKFNTIFISTIPIFIYLIYIIRNKIELVKWNIEIKINYVGTLLFVANLVFFLKLAFMYQGSGDFIKIPHNDYVFYAKISHFFINYGKESFVLSVNAENIPYHYFEIWLNCFFIQFGLNSVNSLLLVVYPLIFTLCIVLSIALIKTLSSEPSRIVLFCFSVFLLQLFYIPFIYDKIPFLNEASSFLVNGWIYQKLSIIYLMLLLAISIYRYYGINAFLIVISFFISFYGSLIFAVLGILSMGILLKVLGQNVIKWYPLIMIAISVALFQVFYTINGYSGDFVPKIDFLFLKTAFNIVIGTIIRLLIFLLPFLVFILLIPFNKLKLIVVKHQIVILIFLSGVFASLFGWAIMHKQVDSVQVFTNFSIPFFCIVLSLFFFKLDYRINVSFLLLTLYFNHYKYTYSSNLQIVKNEKSIFEKLNRGGYIKNKQEYSNPFFINPYFSNPMNEIFLINSSIQLYDLSISETEFINPTVQGLISFHKQRNELFNFSNVNKIYGVGAKVKFIKQNKIQFLIIPKDYLLPLELQKIFYKKKMFESNVVWYK